MRWKKTLAVGLVTALSMSVTACGTNGGTKTGESSSKKDTSKLTYANIELGKSYTDVTASIKVLTNRTDMLEKDYGGKNWDSYIEDFNKTYPNITVKVEGVTNYADDSLLRLQSGDWGDVMMIPAVDKGDLSSYFLSYGSLDEMKEQVNYATQWQYDDEVYGVASTAVGRGIVYNKKVFEKAGITTLPKTPDEFMDDLQKIKDKTSAIPLYTNYAAGWTMSAWDDYIGVTATGDSKYMNQELIHSKAPFSDTGDGTHAYNVYKILYDAVKDGLTESDYSTTDWESSKGMINSGKIACMVLGSWAYPQMQQAGKNADDIGYMPFPMTVNGKQYSVAAPDYCFGINCKAKETNQQAAMVFVKWMTEQSGFSYNEGGLPIKSGEEKYPEVYDSFIENNVQFIPDDPSVEGEEDILNELNADSELMIVSGGQKKVQEIVEHASKNDKSFDDIMNEWNKKWAKAQSDDDVTAN